MTNSEAIAKVSKLRHWTGTVRGPRHTCKCDECRAIKQVCALATEASIRHERSSVVAR